MNEKSLKTLEYNKILEMLENKAISVMGKSKCRELMPMTDLHEIQLAQKETTEATSIILQKSSLPLGGIKDISPSIKRVEVEGVLSITELLHIGDFLHVVKKTIQYGKYESHDDYFDIMENYFFNLETAPKLEKEINRCIESELEVSENASSELSSIRRGMRSSSNKIKDQLSKIIQSTKYKNMLQDSIVTTRNGRYCVPIKMEYRNSFPGMIHDQSSTGATLFIEPASVVDLNNKIKELELKEKEEVQRILKRLSEKVFEYKDIILNNLDILIYLDVVFAKGELSLTLEGSEPIFNTEGRVNIRKARHPLLKGEVVPIDIYLGKDFTTLLITGPNTGGKTVSLKTLGLFTLMGQSGLHISAYDRSELNVFDDVFADIGDEQSIEQSLSTFSSHMTNIVKILKNVTPFSLVLLDELGAGTDPVEGAALAMSILQKLHSRKIRCAVTTHYSELKVYALSTKGVMNAACEFDIETLRPTYKLLIGVPGKSNAFAISKRLGLSDDIIEEAKNFISTEDVKFEDLLTDLEIRRKTFEMEVEKAEDFRKETERLKKDIQQRQDALDKQRDNVINQANKDAHEIMSNAKDKADEMIRKLRKEISNQGAFRNIEDIRGELREGTSELADKLTKARKVSYDIKPIERELKEGDKVFVHTLNQSGYIIYPPDSNDYVTVQAGIMKMKVKLTDLSLDDSKEIVKSSYSYSGAKKGKSINIKPEIDLRGALVNEAISEIDKYLDDAILSGLSQVTIIHGKGTGALRTGVRNFLDTNRHVKSHRLGEMGEGGSGVSVVTLK